MSMSAIEFMNEFMCEGNKNNADEADRSEHSQTFITVNADQTEKELHQSFVGVLILSKYIILIVAASTLRLNVSITLSLLSVQSTC